MMTTDNGLQLTDAEMAALKRVANGRQLIPSEWNDLFEMGLVGVKYTSGLVDQDYLTDLGKRVLAQATPQAEAADGKPGVISAREKEGWKAKSENLQADLATLRRERDVAFADRDEAHKAWDASESQWVQLCDAVGLPYEMGEHAEIVAKVRLGMDALAENGRLREALKPFTELASVVRKWNTDGSIVRTDDSIFYAVNDFALTYGDLRKALTGSAAAPAAGDDTGGG